MTNYDLVPADSSVNPGVRCYGDSLDPLSRAQGHDAVIESMLAGAEPTTASDGLEPADIRFRGRWLGSDAAALAQRLRAIADDPGTTQLSVQAVDETGSDIADPINGTYLIGGPETGAIVVEQVVAGRDSAWEYDVPLIEQ